MCYTTLISDNTLYYFFSTAAQVLASTTALISIVLQFKLNSLKRFLIGDGQAVYNRAIANEYKNNPLNNQQLGRLRDSIEREDIEGIDAVLKTLQDKEEEESPNGFKSLYKRFTKMNNETKELGNIIIQIICYSFATILLSILMIAFVGFISNNFLIGFFSILTIFLLLIFSFWKTYLSIKKILN